MSPDERITRLLGAIEMLPRFGPPLPVCGFSDVRLDPERRSHVAVPARNVDAAAAMYAEVRFGAPPQAPFGVDALRSEIGAALAWMTDGEPIKNAWQTVEEPLGLARTVADSLAPAVLAQLIKLDPGAICLWAGWAHLVSCGLDRVADLLRGVFDVVGLPGQALTVEQVAARQGVSTSVVYRESKKEDSGGLVVSRIGGALRFPPDQFDTNPRSDGESADDPASASVTAEPCSPKRPQGSKDSGTIPGTGSKKPW